MRSIWHWRVLCLLAAGLILAACASGPTAQPADPLEPLNRTVYSFNEAVDRIALEPLAVAYKERTPSVVRTGVGNFFANLEDAWSFVNNVLQLKGEAAASSFMRVSVNSVFGLCGLLDVATEMRIERYTEDFGQTLGYWGVEAGPYIVLPLLGPSNLRDAVATPVDVRGDVVAQYHDWRTRNTLLVLRAVDQRAGLISASKLLDQVALDKYTFVRDAYMQRRRNLVYDGNPPEEEPMDDAGGSR